MRQFDLFALILVGKTFFGHYSKIYFQNQLHHCLIITKVQLSSILKNQYDISIIKLILAVLILEPPHTSIISGIVSQRNDLTTHRYPAGYLLIWQPCFTWQCCNDEELDKLLLHPPLFYFDHLFRSLSGLPPLLIYQAIH